MHKTLLPIVSAAAVLTLQSSCASRHYSTADFSAKNPISSDSRSLDREIAAAREEVSEIDTAVRMMKNGKADVCPLDPSWSLEDAEKELAAAKERLEDLETARRMMARGNAN